MPQAPTDIAIVKWAGPGDPEYLLRPSPDAEPFHEALAGGRLVLRTCAPCGHSRYPHGPVCPYCGSVEFEWREVPAGATLVSWGRCHLELVPEFPPPYLVACAQLDAGPPMIGALLEPADLNPAVGARLRVVAQRWPSGTTVAAFQFDETSAAADAAVATPATGASS